MSSFMNKRKLLRLDDSEDEDFDASPAIKKNQGMNSFDTKKGKKKKRIILLDSDEDEDQDKNSNIIEDSISDIKKHAKARAKKLATGMDEIEKHQDKSIKTKKTPPSDSKQKNNILNYFKPRNPDIQKDNSSKKQEIDIKSENVDEDGYMLTKVKRSEKSNRDVLEEKRCQERNISDRKNNNLKSKVEETSESKSPSKKSSLAIKNGKNRNGTPIKELENEKSFPKENLKPPEKSEKIIKINEKNKSPKKPPPKELPRIVEPKPVSDLWVDKYKPKSTKQIIGQQGHQSALNKLIKWLSSWHKNFDRKPAYGSDSGDGAGFRAALLSGPPGIGKTTTAQLVCLEVGYDYLELNASDTRSKKSLNESVRQLLGNTKLTSFFQTTSEKSKDKKITSKHCLIMDEVDGVSGNEDRGGVAELIQLIKSTKIPIICICNDRGDTKIRSLVNYCLDLRFPKPKSEQIKAVLMSIAFKEKFKVSSDVLNRLIVSSNNDIRQCIHNLYLLATNCQTVGKMISSNEKPIKDVRLTPFEAIRKVFATGEEYLMMSFNDKSNLFFCDYSIMPLFVHENYRLINLATKQPSVGKQMKRLYKTIDSISYGEIIEKEIRTNQAWSLLPLQAAFSTVMPSCYMRSQQGLAFPRFPEFMGKLSTTNKNNRIIEELLSHMRLSVSGSKSSLVLDYIETIRNIIIQSLVNLDKNAISIVIDLLEEYSLTKEDMDSILQYCLWNGDDDPMKKIDSKTKAALTRAYNQKKFTLPYSRENDYKEITKKGGRKDQTRTRKRFQDEDEDEDGSDQE